MAWSTVPAAYVADLTTKVSSIDSAPRAAVITGFGTGRTSPPMSPALRTRTSTCGRQPLGAFLTATTRQCTEIFCFSARSGPPAPGASAGGESAAGSGAGSCGFSQGRGPPLPLTLPLPAPLAGALPPPLSGALPPPFSGALPATFSGALPPTLAGPLPPFALPFVLGPSPFEGRGAPGGAAHGNGGGAACPLPLGPLPLTMSPFGSSAPLPSGRSCPVISQNSVSIAMAPGPPGGRASCAD
mmetsp:Transcript_60757/g.170231  ORF Transcript_60757/g.170231 Transcript_60757/m.170231 type:complete len:242 (-) Transcript_60757:28-753(-)